MVVGVARARARDTKFPRSLSLSPSALRTPPAIARLHELTCGRREQAAQKTSQPNAMNSLLARSLACLVDLRHEKFLRVSLSQSSFRPLPNPNQKILSN